MASLRDREHVHTNACADHPQSDWKAAHDDLYDRLSHIQAERDELHAENEALRKELALTETAARMGEYTEGQLEAENKRLWDALVAMQNRVPMKGSALGQHTCGECRMCFEIAESALATAKAS